MYVVVSFQIFNVVVNGVHTVVEELDIYSKVGRGVAHDEIIPFTVKNGKIRINGESSPIENGKVPVRFEKVGAPVSCSALFCFLCCSTMFLSLSLSFFPELTLLCALLLYDQVSISVDTKFSFESIQGASNFRCPIETTRR